MPYLSSALLPASSRDIPFKDSLRFDQARQAPQQPSIVTTRLVLTAGPLAYLVEGKIAVSCNKELFDQLAERPLANMALELMYGLDGILLHNIYEALVTGIKIVIKQPNRTPALIFDSPDGKKHPVILVKNVNGIVQATVIPAKDYDETRKPHDPYKDDMFKQEKYRKFKISLTDPPSLTQSKKSSA